MSTISDAIRRRLELEFLYDGQPRIVRPAAHGIHKDTGNEVLRGYQVGGRSNSRTIPLWSLFLVNKIQNLVVTDRTFSTTLPGFSRKDKAMSTILAEL